MATVGIWIMPDNNANGMLEDFVKELIPTNDKLIPVVKTTLNNIENKGINRYKRIHRTKAQIHTWLAWQEVPGVPMGTAISKKYLDSNSELCQTFVHWIKDLFE